jgi:hypothetical protein
MKAFLAMLTMVISASNMITRWDDLNAFLSFDLRDGQGAFIDTTGPVIAGTGFQMEFFNMVPGYYQIGTEMDGPLGGVNAGGSSSSFYWDGLSIVTTRVTGDWFDGFCNWTITVDQ